MHKIKKGIKKKIKGKKDKDEEIFTEEEFERYKKQKEDERRQEEEPIDELNHHSFIEEQRIEEPEEVKSEEEGTQSEDWRNYLCSADVVLKQTSENLEHIKESSYFKLKRSKEANNYKENDPVRPVTPSDLGKNWVNLDKGGFSDEEEEKDNQVHLPVEPEKSIQERVRELKEIAPIEHVPSIDTEDYADIFDTTYVDQVESGEIQLYIIPESPTDDNPLEPDPFDTSGVDKILQKEKPKGKKKEKKDSKNKKVKEVKPVIPIQPVIKKKIVVNLGSAVQALTNDTASEITAYKVNNLSSTRRVPEINLLGGDDKEENSGNQPQVTEETKEKENKLDNILFSDTNTEDLPILICQINNKDSEGLENFETPEFNNCQERTLNSNIKEKAENENGDNLQNIVDEFDVILKETTHEYNNNLELITESSKNNSELEDEFSVLAEESLSKNKENLTDPVEVDPFDTSVAERVIGEIYSVEKNTNFPESHANKEIREGTLSTEIIESDPFDTSEVKNIVIVDPFDTVFVKDLPETLVPQCATSIQNEENFDPFDTSTVGNFGKTELKYFEEELLSNLSKNEEEDLDFNPREEESQQDLSYCKKHECLLSTNDETVVEPVLSPKPFSVQKEDLDPFDTSIADKLQIKHLEKELLEEGNNIKYLQSHSPNSSNEKDSFSSNTLDLTADYSLSAILNANIDPFDTSIIDSICEKVKVVAEENIKQAKDSLTLKLKPPRPPSPTCLLASTPIDENPTLLPRAKSPKTVLNSEIVTESDPFDTSIAAQFGKTELKALESELLTTGAPSIEEDISNFNPREQEHEYINNKSVINRVSPTCLLTSLEQVDQPLPPLSPGKLTPLENSAEIDPFDTSVAEKLGISELSFFESKSEKENRSSLSLELTSSEKVPPPRLPVLVKSTDCIISENTTNNNTSLPPTIPFTETSNAKTTEEFDPFDTSIADNFGKTELRILEETLFTNSNDKEEVPAVTNQVNNIDIRCQNFENILCDPIILDNQPVLHPTSEIDNRIAIEKDDPFDTTIANKFSNTELRVLESELLTDSGVKRYLSDEEEFDPRKEEIRTSRIVNKSYKKDKSAY